MELYMVFLIIVVILLSIVVYQSRNDQMNISLYVQRFSHLIMMIINYLKDIGHDSAVKLQSIDWDLTK
jgi:hypothetical protein